MCGVRILRCCALAVRTCSRLSAALQGAIRSERDLLDLLEPPAKTAAAPEEIQHGDRGPPRAQRVTFGMKEAAN